MKRTIKDIEEILKKAKAVLQKIYGKRLKGVILYGSYARGDAVEGSDIDLIVLLDMLFKIFYNQYLKISKATAN